MTFYPQGTQFKFCVVPPESLPNPTILSVCSSVIETGHGNRSPLKLRCTSLPKGRGYIRLFTGFISCLTGSAQGPVCFRILPPTVAVCSLHQNAEVQASILIALITLCSAFRILTTREGVWAVIFNNHWGIHPSRLYLIFFEATYTFSFHNILWHWAWQSNYITFEALLVFVFLKPA